MVNLLGDRAQENRRSDRRHSANLLWGRVDSCVMVRASIVFSGVRVGDMLRGSTDVSKGAKLDMFQVAID